MLDELLAFVRQQDRVCPVPGRWAELYDLLPGRSQDGAGWHPAVPLILGGWWYSSIQDKRERLAEHIQYAAANGALPFVEQFLRGLPASEWAHVQDFGSR